MKAIRKLYFKIFKHYRRIQVRPFTYADADKLIRENEGKPESEQWVIANEEDINIMFGLVFLERKERIRI